MADRSPEAVAADLPEAVSVAELILKCLALGKTQCFVAYQPNDWLQP